VPVSVSSFLSEAPGAPGHAGCAAGQGPRDLPGAPRPFGRAAGPGDGGDRFRGRAGLIYEGVPSWRATPALTWLCPVASPGTAGGWSPRLLPARQPRVSGRAGLGSRPSALRRGHAPARRDGGVWLGGQPWSAGRSKFRGDQHAIEGPEAGGWFCRGGADRRAAAVGAAANVRYKKAGQGGPGIPRGDSPTHRGVRARKGRPTPHRAFFPFSDSRDAGVARSVREAGGLDSRSSATQERLRVVS